MLLWGTFCLLELKSFMEILCMKIKSAPSLFCMCKNCVSFNIPKGRLGRTSGEYCNLSTLPQLCRERPVLTRPLNNIGVTFYIKSSVNFCLKVKNYSRAIRFWKLTKHENSCFRKCARELLLGTIFCLALCTRKTATTQCAKTYFSSKKIMQTIFFYILGWNFWDKFGTFWGKFGTF